MNKTIAIVLISLLPLSMGLALISSGPIDSPEALQGWESFFAVSLLGAGLIFGAWSAIRRENTPSWLGWLILGAVMIRLLVGIFWFTALPQWGYASEPELDGYIMADAYNRDTAAWNLAQSDHPLLEAFDGHHSGDQYGGMIFFSATIYRYFGATAHAPLMIVVLTATFSALAALFTWAFAHRLWDDDIAKVAACLLALYPEAVLLGSSQMREAFTMTLAAAAIYGVILVSQKHTWTGAAWLLVSLGLSLPLSPTFTILLVGVLVIVALFLAPKRLLRDWRLWVGFGALILIGLGGVWVFGQQLMPGGASNPVTLLRQWSDETAKWQAIVSRQASGWMYKLLEKTGPDLYKWIVLVYGVVQPFLPAAVIANGIWIWRSIAIWRSLGWTLLLPFLIYAPMRSLQKRGPRSVLGISTVVWAVILAASFRSGGDQWDNPRYRAAFACLQIALVAWVWVEQQRDPDPWLRRMLVGAGFVLAWFVPWYLRRYTPLTWPVIDVFKTFGLGIASAILYWLWDWARVKPLTNE
ncbi:MAG: hypothetical protein U9Q82_04585 [Chloroflexota bacterium]|nr:hypothetical protein [Chloroflexota bacterium]